MSALPNITLSAIEYLALERKSPYKHEYWAGQIYAMAGASERHNLITTNVVMSLGLQVRGRSCKVYPNDMRVKISATGLYTYPDIVVVCGKAHFEDKENDTLINPTIILEVLSKSTESYDRGKKFENYRTLESLTEYLLIAQDTHHLEHYIRQADQQWLFSEVKGVSGRIELPTIQCTLHMADIYDKVEIALDPLALHRDNRG